MSAEILAALKRIEAKLDAALAKLQSEERRKPAPASENVASDRDLDSKYGNPKVRFDPKDWDGGTCKGRLFSECPADYLEMLANAYEYFAEKNAASDPKKAGYERLDAARARGWAKRIEGGWKADAQQETPSGGNYDFDSAADPNSDIPF